MHRESPICYLDQNLKFLRERSNMTQTELAGELNITRAKVNAYENSVNKNPTVEDLFKFSNYYKVTADFLLWKNLKITEPEATAANNEYLTGAKLRILATTIDKNNKENIEIVPIKAKAGYVAGMGDPEFIRKLPAFQFPVLTNEKKYRMFQIEGDSMLPIPDKSFIIAEYVEDWNGIKDKQAYVIITMNEGIVFKQVVNEIEKSKSLLLHSLNPIYKDYSVNITEIKEVWKFSNYVSAVLPAEGITLETLGHMLVDLKDDLLKIKSQP